MQPDVNEQLPPVPLDLEDIKHVARQRRVYQVWQGSNRFFLGGRLIFGPDVRSLLLTIVMILAPAAIFYKFVALDLLEKLPGHGGLTVMVVAGALIFFVLLFLFLTSSRDPGIVPRNKHPPEPDDDFDISNIHSDCTGRQTPFSRLPRTKDVIVNGIAVKIKYCDTCMLYRPPRCSHCSICNNCVERFDHHCPWVGQCIGRRNYLFFIIFISITSILCLYIFTMSAILVKMIMDEPKCHHMVWKALEKSPASIFLMIYSFCATWFVGGLTLFHLYLISKNQTTYENFRYRYEKKVNPYDKGPRHNFRDALCAGIPPSKNDFRAKVEQEDEPSISSRQLHIDHHHLHINQPASAGLHDGLSTNPDHRVLWVSPSSPLKDLKNATSGYPPSPLGTPDGYLSEQWSRQTDKADVAAANINMLCIADNMLSAMPADHDVEDTPPVRDKISSPPQQLDT